MNAIEIWELVRKRGGALTVEGDRLVLAGDTLSEDLEAEVREHSADLMVALGGPMNVAEVIEDVRPHLPESLSALTDDKLLRLVRWALVTSWNAGLRKLEVEQRPKARRS